MSQYLSYLKMMRVVTSLCSISITCLPTNSLMLPSGWLSAHSFRDGTTTKGDMPDAARSLITTVE